MNMLVKPFVGRFGGGDTNHFSIGITGLVYLAVLVGYVCGLGLFYMLSDRTVARMTKAKTVNY